MPTTDKKEINIITRSNAASNLGQCDCDCDCACSLPSQEQAAVDLSTLAQIEKIRIAKFKSLPLNEEFAICFGPSSRPLVLNQAAISMLSKIDGQSYVSVERLLAQANGTPFANDFLMKLLQAGLVTNTQVKNSDPNLLTAWVHVTDRCNLRCEYCYLPHHPEDMEVETGMKVMQSLVTSAKDNRYKKMKVKFAGGEPLLKFERIIAWHSFARKLADAEKIILDSVILSNGTLLTSNMAHKIKQENLRLMISLDGLQNAHDSHRKFLNGKGSFEQTIRGIEIAISAGIFTHISITVSPSTAPYLPELTSWLLAKGGLSFNFNFVRSIKTNPSPKEQQVLADSLLQVLEIIKNSPSKQDILTGLIDRINLATPRIHPCAIEHDYVVFDTNGYVARCQMEVHKAAPCVGKDPIQAVRNQPEPLNLSVDQKTSCVACDWKHWCAGGCPLLENKSQYCEVYKTVLPQVLRVEGLRLLSQAIQ